MLGETNGKSKYHSKSVFKLILPQISSSPKFLEAISIVLGMFIHVIKVGRVLDQRYGAVLPSGKADNVCVEELGGDEWF